ncbi:unnamed protein product [Symbiodinium sp. CCMP2456]|nr:unnamed protein product [Symbiodinium sp. CCMP2456]
MHPFRQNEDSFTVKAVGIGSSLAVHAASSAPNADLLETKLSVSQDAVDNDPVSVAARAKAWQEKVAVGVAQRLLSRHNSTARLGTALEAAPSEKATASKRTSKLMQSKASGLERWLWAHTLLEHALGDFKLEASLILFCAKNAPGIRSLRSKAGTKRPAPEESGVPSPRPAHIREQPLSFVRLPCAPLLKKEPRRESPRHELWT